jgi:uncharacterized membrane protein
MLTVAGYIIGAIIIIVGIILLIIGTIFYNNKAKCDEDIPSWIWIMVAIGILLMLIGLIIVVFTALRAASKKEIKDKHAGKEYLSHHEDGHLVM